MCTLVSNGSDNLNKPNGNEPTLHWYCVRTVLQTIAIFFSFFFWTVFLVVFFRFVLFAGLNVQFRFLRACTRYTCVYLSIMQMYLHHVNCASFITQSTMRSKAFVFHKKYICRWLPINKMACTDKFGGEPDEKCKADERCELLQSTIALDAIVSSSAASQ